MRGISVPVVLLHLILALSSRPVQADAVQTSGDILQYVVPALALGMTGYERDLPGAGQLVTSALVTESLVWTLKRTVDEKGPTGGGRGFRLSTLLHCA